MDPNSSDDPLQKTSPAQDPAALSHLCAAQASQLAVHQHQLNRLDAPSSLVSNLHCTPLKQERSRSSVHCSPGGLWSGLPLFGETMGQLFPLLSTFCRDLERFSTTPVTEKGPVIA